MLSNILTTVIDLMKASTKPPFEQGDIDEWSKWAFRMQRVSLHSVPILNTIKDSYVLLEDRIKELEATIQQKDQLISEIVKKIT